MKERDRAITESKMREMRFVLVKRAPYTIENPVPTDSRWMAQVSSIGLASSVNVLQ